MATLHLFLFEAMKTVDYPLAIPKMNISPFRFVCMAPRFGGLKSRGKSAQHNPRVSKAYIGSTQNDDTIMPRKLSTFLQLSYPSAFAWDASNAPLIQGLVGVRDKHRSAPTRPYRTSRHIGVWLSTKWEVSGHTVICQKGAKTRLNFVHCFASAHIHVF